MHDPRGTYDVADSRGDVERNENAICVYPSVILCVRILLEAVYPRACKPRVRLFMQRPSSSFPLTSPSSLSLLPSPFNLPILRSVSLFISVRCFSAFFATCTPLRSLPPLSLSFAFYSSVLVVRAISLHLLRLTQSYFSSAKRFYPSLPPRLIISV